MRKYVREWWAVHVGGNMFMNGGERMWRESMFMTGRECMHAMGVHLCAE
jgi:hypothetical protein